MIRVSFDVLLTTYQAHAEYDLLTLKVRSQDGAETVVFSGPVDRDKLAEWVDNLLKNQEDEFPFAIENDESLASAVQRLYEELDPETDEASFRKLYKYRCIHDLSLGNRGVETPSIIIGKRKGKLTISRDNLSFQIQDLSSLVKEKTQ